MFYQQFYAVTFFIDFGDKLSYSIYRLARFEIPAATLWFRYSIQFNSIKSPSYPLIRVSLLNLQHRTTQKKNEQGKNREKQKEKLPPTRIELVTSGFPMLKLDHKWI